MAELSETIDRKPKRSRRKKRRDRTRRAPVGAAPGTLISDPDAHQPRLTLRVLGEDGRHEVHDDIALADLDRLGRGWSKMWLDCTGLAQAELVEEIGQRFGFHPLALEDVLNVGQRPKTEFHDDHLFVILPMLDGQNERGREQVAIFFSQTFVITFQERPGDVFDPVRRRIDAGGKRLFDRGADYLAYALIDAIVDGYFPLLETRSEEIDRLEDDVLDYAEQEQLTRMYEMRREVRHLLQLLWPLRDAVAALVRTESEILSDDTQRFLNDTQDHAIQLLEMSETHRDTLTGLIELHMSLASARTNEVVNLLTIVSTIFIPLGFLAGLWGMNFNPETSPWNMPELSLYFGYPTALGLMLIIALGLIWYFRRKGWLGRD
ncbi:magnesium/cobalt transporter CorA [Notoacmeibacter sp. MSK16QG-6]|uniref:magnesium/cobalt transporter CorA n=1 Tax=Notoacmeibacter sp. MSK16QG-6 TaxID=2957982 RepID=UPI00209FBCA0|nr:magnesium/cobalt transporter CorA [Notoacmeibacter sp. MSK16QG-6]MCP1198791.1 magnesium/cobalt transporter CorA [Notoacmeibacter sp. MSK16QG-6]